MGMSTGNEPGAVKSDINVTPLVDVCLVLLIIFMVVTPMLQKGVDVQLPETAKPEKMPEGAKQVTVAIKLDGTVYLEKNPLKTKAERVQAFKELFANSPQKDIVIKADKRLKYKDVRDVMRVINEAGFSGVGLVADRKVSG
jgi:biopolymer transport protein TolR